MTYEMLGTGSCDRCNKLAENLNSLQHESNLDAAGAMEATRYRDNIIAELRQVIANQMEEIAALKERIRGWESRATLAATSEI